MELYRYRLYLLVLATSLIFLASGCKVVIDALDCDGFVEQSYDIADIVLVTNAEQFARDLEAHPEVFYQTGGERLYFEAESSNYDVADVFTDEYGYVTVVAGRPGRAEIVVEARDSCSGYASTTFKVEVIEFGAGSNIEKIQ